MEAETLRFPPGDAWEGLAAMRLVAVNLQPSEPDGPCRAAENEAVVPRDALMFRRAPSSALRRSDIPEPDEQVTAGAFAFAGQVSPRARRSNQAASNTDITCDRRTMMESGTYTRQKLVRIVVALLGVALLYLLFSDLALAEDAAAPPACGGTAWMLTSVALVLMMTIPGLGLFYGGMVRKKNVGDTVMTSFAVTCLVTILFAICTYSMAFRAGSPFIGGLDRMFLKDIVSDIGHGGIGNPNPLAATIPESVYICFQMTFAIITPALIAGAFAERMKFSAMLWFIGLWAIFVYA